jgi:glucan-binding YG repeat protein
MEEEIKNEDYVSDAEVSEIEEEEIEKTPKKKRKSDFYIELALFLILGVLIGVALKTEAVKTITIGFDDYKMKIFKQDYDINQLQADLVKKNAAAAQPSNTAQPSDQSSPDQGATNQDNSAPENAAPTNSDQGAQNQAAPDQGTLPTNGQ